MAYVNMTVDGQTKQTSILNFKDVNDNLKTASLSAVVEDSDKTSGGTSYERYTASADCTTYGQIWQMMINDGKLATQGNYVLVTEKSSMESTQLVNMITNGSGYLAVTTWRKTSCKSLASIGNNEDPTACVLSQGDVFMFIPF